MSRSAAVLWGRRLPTLEYGTSKEPHHTGTLTSTVSGSNIGSDVTFFQSRGHPTVTHSKMVNGGNASIRVTRPHALLEVDAVLGRGTGFPLSVMNDKWELAIIQTMESNDDKRYYGATNRSKDFYFTCRVRDNRKFPILDMITSPSDQTAPAGDPSYSVTAMASFDPHEIGSTASDSIHGATSGTIYAQFEPSVEARCVIPFSEHPDTFRSHGLTAPRYYLTEIEKKATVRTWISTRDKTTKDVYPLMMLERSFEFVLQVKVNDETGNDISDRFVDISPNVSLPTVYLDGDGRCLPIPSFPRAAVRPGTDGKYFVANDAFSWTTVFL
ncbi:uncharacterized protein LOC134180036 isoform X1 [Corticium candelabrum]|uniref:uncharacterized protein LOC134180036 isoform X1 n=2 Tax=Corticium candelabrum TaxID=121492 RepID=UPI002E257801|nr:uncharacterized protein LOC134180036 isoform X1 [Corticium candelabrum]